MDIGQNSHAARLLSGVYTSWLLRNWALTYLLSPLLYEWFWPHTDAYHNAYGFWGPTYPVILFLFNAVIGLPLLLTGILCQEYVVKKMQLKGNSRALCVLIIFLLVLLGQMALKALLFSMPFFTLFKDAAGPTFVAAAVSLLVQGRLLFRKQPL
jgi:hypothetical protein